MEYGYGRISIPKQSIERQIRNIKNAYPNAVIITEVYTGTKFQGRKELDKILSKVKAGDTIIFDSISRMSRTAEEGFNIYQELFDIGVNFVFLKEAHINTDTYKEALDKKLSISLKSGDEATDELMNVIIAALNKYILNLAKKQIYLAFEQAEKEVANLHQRTKEGIETARLNGKQIRRVKGSTYETKKAVEVKKMIRQYSKDFEGSLKDVDVMKLISIPRNSYYKYKKEISCNIE